MSPQSHRTLQGPSRRLGNMLEPLDQRLCFSGHVEHAVPESETHHSSAAETHLNSGSTAARTGSVALFDFTDAFYQSNGVDPTKIAGRPTGTSAGSAITAAPDATHRNVRLTAINGMHDDGGKANFFGVLGTIQANAFTANAAGVQARQIADKYVAYIFPKAGSNPLSPASKRQDELIPLNNGYFSNDPLQVWREAFVNYVPGAANSGDAKKVADDLRRKNGVDGDGTPMIRTLSDLDKAKQSGLVTVTLRANDGSQGAPWFFCATFKEFKGTIPSDTTLTVVRNADGTASATSSDIQSLFDSLRKPTTLAELA